MPLSDDAVRVTRMTLHQGDRIHLPADPDTYQVIAVDDRHDRCWVRRWPLERQGSPVFEVSLQVVEASPEAAPTP